MNRELVMLAKTFDPDKHEISGWHCSVKYDGQRAFWDGGVTRGYKKIMVPWANNAKDERYKEEQISTGLWSRYGNVIHASDSFLDKLPQGILLDGELWYGRGKLQSLLSIVSKLKPNESLWDNIKYIVFEQPPVSIFTINGRINNPQFSRIIHADECMDWFDGFTRVVPLFKSLKPFPLDHNIEQIVQIVLPNRQDLAVKKLYDLLDEETSKKGEGLMLRDPFSCYQVKRSASLLKVKQFEYSLGEVIGWKLGVGKYEGMMGSLAIKSILKGKEVEFNLSGFIDEQRQINNGMPVHFKIGQTIKFKYASLTKDGVPREGRFDRVSHESNLDYE